MAEMEDKLGEILGNPAMMQQIMAMAQSLGQQAPPQSKPEPAPEPPLPNLDPAMLQKVMGMAQQTGIDKNQQALLRALNPYLTRDRIQKLEKAMRAAKLAGLASSFFGNGGLSFLTGR